MTTTAYTKQLFFFLTAVLSLVIVIASMYWSTMINDLSIIYAGLAIGGSGAFAALIGLGTVYE